MTIRLLPPTEFTVQIGTISISPVEGREWLIALYRDGEGGEFSMREFEDILHQFISERL
ncbi:MAG TPA: hypothetical protein VJO13_18980 [Ktedonobacterales bacterium]|nr:hypothetical protein [Ktedonobacterales bacterium]